jgi:hypothetical protein
MSSIVLGQADRHNISLDVDVLLRTRLLIQANSGQGKSFLLRRMAEQLFGKVQVILIDPEGEFATLREKYGYVLVGKGGETPADARSAALVAQKLLELKASAVCDLYEMKPSQRHEWVRLFGEALIDAPKALWHPVVVILDEAHVYIPEKSAGESEASEAMIGISTRGRKRGFAMVAATQRLGKLRKDFAAELLNVLIGGTVMDIDRKRAGDALGVYGHDQREFFDAIKLLKPGEFWALGPALCRSYTLFKVGAVQTTHPEAGSAKLTAEPPPPPEAIAKLLPKLADLPKAAEEKAKTEAELRGEIRSLKAQLRERPTAQPVADRAELQHEIKAWQDRAALEAKRHLDHIGVMKKKVQAGVEKVTRAHQLVEAAMVRVRQSEDEITSIVSEIAAIVPSKAPSVSQNGQSVSQNRGFVSSRMQITTTHEPAAHDPTLPPGPRGAGSIRVDMGEDGTERDELTGPEQRIIDAIAWQNSIGIEEPDQVAVAFLARYTYGTGGFNNAKGSLRTKGMVEYRGDRIVLTDAGKRLANAAEEDLTTDELHKRVLSVLPNPEQRILKPLLEAYPKALHDEVLAPLANYKPGVGGFNNPKGKLRTLGLIEYPQPRHSVASKILFLD